MGIHVGSFTLGGIVGAGVMGYVIMKSPIGDEVKGRVVNVLKKEAEEGIHFLLWGEDKKSTCYRDFIRYDKKGRSDYTPDYSVIKDEKVGRVYFKTIDDAREIFYTIHDEIETYRHFTVANFIILTSNSRVGGKKLGDITVEYSDYKYGWDMTDEPSFNEKNFDPKHIPGMGWQFWFPCVHKIYF